MSAVAVAVGEVKSEVKNQINIRIRNKMIDDAKQNRKHTNQTNISKASDAMGRRRNVKSNAQSAWY